MSKQFTFLDLASVLRVEGGDLFWIARRGSARAGKRAGRFDRYGYITLRFDGVDLLAHRVIWLLTHGRYQAQCGKKYLGSYDTEVEAAFA